MSSTTETLGTAWQNCLGKTTDPLFDLAANVAAFEQGQRQLETQAAAVIDRLIAGDVRTGILSCMKRGSNALGIEIPAHVLGTTAFARFRRWLAEERLDATVPEIKPGADGGPMAHVTIQPGR